MLPFNFVCAQQEFLKEGLELHYAFDGNDNYSASRDLTYIDGPNRNSRGVYLNGTTSYIQTHLTKEYINRTKTITVSSWVKADPEKQPKDGFGVVFFDAGHGLYNTSGNENKPFGLWLLPNFLKNEMYWTAYSLNPPGTYARVANVLDTTDWNYITYVFDLISPTHRADMYVNGEKVDSFVPQFDSFQMLGEQVYIGLVRTWLDIDNLQDGFSFGSPAKLASYRVYNRSLSDLEVKSLFNYENYNQQNTPRIATATPQIINGFVVGTTITDGGSGYTAAPIITISGGGGTGARAVATVEGGAVTGITILNPGSGYTSTPTLAIASPPFPPRQATGTTEVFNGFVVGVKIVDGGYGYTTPPSVLVVGGGGAGATATATVTDGVVTGIILTSTGSGYTSTPTLQIATPPFDPELFIEVSRVNVRLKVVVGARYQLESSSDMTVWTPTGPSFIAEDAELIQEFVVENPNRYFRIKQVP